jgi:hypothetical protein
VTAQIADRLAWSGVTYEIATIAGGPLFEPGAHAIRTSSSFAACTRGYQALYGVRKNKLVVTELLLHLDPDALARSSQRFPPLFGVTPSSTFPGRAVYANLDLATPCTGGLLVGAELIRGLAIPRGLQPAWKYARVREFTFRAGTLVSERDLSPLMAEVRRRLGLDHLPPSGGADLETMPADRVDPVVAWLRTQLVLPYPWR